MYILPKYLNENYEYFNKGYNKHDTSLINKILNNNKLCRI